MIHEVTGDIVLTRARSIAHGVAPTDRFDRGVALALRERWPGLATDFALYAHDARPAPGEVWAWTGADGKTIISLLTRDSARDDEDTPAKATLAHVNEALLRLRLELQRSGARSVALPRLSTGVGGLAWTDVLPLIVHHLSDLGIPVFVYTTFLHGKRAFEGGA